MTRLLARLGVIFWVIVGLVACVDREGPADEEATILYFVDPVPDGEQQYVPVDEPFIGTRVNESGAGINNQAVSLFSFDADADDPIQPTTEILRSDLGARPGIVQALNTDYDVQADSEFSIVVKNGSIFVVDHENGSYRGLVHFAETVCEVRPKKTVEKVTRGSNVTYNVLHDKSIYVKTSEGPGSVSDCSDPAKFKRYYRLALNFRFDSFESDPNYSNDLVSVSEAEYSAELVFGWNDSQATVSNPNQRLDYGFLGYDSQTRELVFYDASRQRVWSQARRLELFNTANDEGTLPPQTWFKLEELPKYQAMVQLGRDVFIVDAGSEFFNRTSAEVPTILSDRAYQKVAEAGNKYTRELDVVHNDKDVLIRDVDKFYRYAYAPDASPPSANTYTVNDLPSLGYGSETHEQKHLFTQFDLRSCERFSDEEECALVNFHQGSNAEDWQFVTSCKSDEGCTLPTDTTDYCTTQAEFILTQDGRNLCTVKHHTHLNELNNSANDASLLGFLPYAGYSRDMEFVMDEQSVYITARMNERDILLRYFYQIPLSAPKVSREQVIFGQRIAHAGLDVYLNEGNLFSTALNNVKENVRNNECYRGYARVDCAVCLPEEFLNGKCVDHFNEYRSMALFCSAQTLEEGSCTDSQIGPINELARHDSDKDGKWLEVLDITAGTGAVSRTMSLVRSDSVSDEGVLSSPTIFEVDNQSGEVNVVQGQELGVIPGQVEAVYGRWNLDERISRLNVVRQDILTSDSKYAKAAVLVIDANDPPPPPPAPSLPTAVEAGVKHFVREASVVSE